MELLLTGASGFLGRNLILQAPADWNILALYCNDRSFPEFLAQAGKPRVHAARCDLADPDQVAALLRERGSDWECCLHLAARVDIPWSVREPRADLLSNTGSLLNLLAVLRARKFVYFSSGAVYDGLSGEISPDTHFTPTLPYAISKMTSERYVQFYRERARSIDDYLIIRFFGAYGPYEAPHKIYTNLVKAFALEGKDRYSIYGGGQNLIDAMYVGDAVDAVFRILAGTHWNQAVNLAGGRPMTIEALVQEAGRIFGHRSVTLEKRGVAHESNQFWGSTAEMKTLFGFEASTSLSSGLLRLRDFLQNSAVPALTGDRNG